VQCSVVVKLFHRRAGGVRTRVVLIPHYRGTGTAHVRADDQLAASCLPRNKDDQLSPPTRLLQSRTPAPKCTVAGQFWNLELEPSDPIPTHQTGRPGSTPAASVQCSSLCSFYAFVFTHGTVATTLPRARKNRWCSYIWLYQFPSRRTFHHYRNSNIYSLK